MRDSAKLLVIVAIVGSTIGCDRTTKHIAERELSGGSRRSYLADTVRLEYIENRGAFLSLGAGLPERVRTVVFTGGTAVALAGLSIMLARQFAARWAFLGLSLVWAGSVSNLVDRLVKGSVVDFLNVGVGSFRTGIFNLADVAIMIGAGLVLVVGAGRDGVAEQSDAADERRGGRDGAARS